LGSSWPESAGEEDRLYLLSYLEERFGILKSLFDEYLFFKKSKSWWILKYSPLVTSISHLKVWRVGLKAFQEVGRFVKPTTRMIQIFGRRADRALMDISENDLKKLAAGEFIPADMPVDNGYIILAMEGGVLGLGLLIDGFVRSQIPKKDIRLMTLLKTV
jgi:NOL1/NOP2/fmu family ribosome biogenesis protein